MKKLWLFIVVVFTIPLLIFSNNTSYSGDDIAYTTKNDFEYQLGQIEPKATPSLLNLKNAINQLSERISSLEAKNEPTPVAMTSTIVLSTESPHLTSVQNSSSSSEACGPCGPSGRIAIRHIEGKGIGYNQGYSTLEGFFTPFTSSDQSNYIPFLDLRGHIFNNGRFAANIGIGLRYLNTRVWGVNIYYDYRKSKHHQYNQFSLGVESLGEILDFRINGYLPVGDTSSSMYHTKFSHFVNHSMILSSKKEFAMRGLNAEVGAHIKRFKNVVFYGAAGPYFFSNFGKQAWGGETRLVAGIYDYVNIQVNGSYDTVFKGIVQGQIGLSIPLGPKKQSTDSCGQEFIVKQRARERVDRNEIIILDKKTNESVAINPLTGQPYFFWFVDNTSSSLGTFESPFPTLLAAQNNAAPHDIIYVYPGDGTNTGMNVGVVLQDYQRLLGTGIAHQFRTTLGEVDVPILAPGLPTITSTPTSRNVTTMANNNEVSGFNIIQTATSAFDTSCVSLNGLDGLITNNTFTVSHNEGEGVSITASSCGTAIISNNIFRSNDSANTSMGLNIHDSTGNIIIQDNLFTGVDASTGLSNGVRCAANNGHSINITVTNNVFNSQTNTTAFFNPSAIDLEIFSGNINNSMTATVIGNNINVPSGISHAVAGVYALENVAPVGQFNLNVSDNTSITTGAVPGYKFENLSGNPALMQVNFNNNIGTKVGP